MTSYRQGYEKGLQAAKATYQLTYREHQAVKSMNAKLSEMTAWRDAYAQESDDRGNMINHLLAETEKLRREIKVLKEERKGAQAVAPVVWTLEYREKCQARFKEELDRLRAAPVATTMGEEAGEEAFEDLGFHALDLVSEKA
jgi:hypothetical protein